MSDRRFLFAALFCVMSGCQSPGLRELRKPVAPSAAIEPVLNPRRLSPETVAVLRRDGLTKTERHNPAEAIRRLDRSIAGSPLEDPRRTALAEVLCHEAASLQRNDIPAAIGWYLTAAQVTYPAAIASQHSGEPASLLALYNHACGQVAKLAFSLGPGKTQTRSVVGPLRSYTLTFRNEGAGIFDPAWFDDLKVAEYLKVRGYQERETAPGVGGALVGHRDHTPERAEVDPLLPDAGMALPVTATLRFSGTEGNSAELALHDVLLGDRARLGNDEVRLAADFTVALALLASLEPSRSVGRKAMLRPAKYLSKTGLYELEPYRPDKIPVVLVHGLSKTPADWGEAINELRSDPLIREHYQFLCFRYPSGFPATFCGSALRHHLQEFRDRVDPAGLNPRMDRMVLIGKSFGGLLASQQVRESGESLRELFVDHPLTEFDLPDRQREALEATLYFQPDPDIARVVFIATPHLGTDRAASALGTLTDRIIRYPKDLLTDGDPPDFDGLTDLARDYLAHPPTSVENLRPHSPVLETIRAMPIRPGVPIHSIIGRVGNGPLEQSDDTMVPYWSSHLEDVASETVVNGKHNEIAHHPEAIQEIHRILRLHLEEE